MRKIFWLCLYVILTLSFNANAVSFSQNTEYVKLTLTPEYKTLAKDKENINFIATVDIKPDWHIYWDNPGDAGDPTTLTFYDSPHYTLQESIHSAPQKFVLEDIITTYIHRQKLYFKLSFALKNLTSLTHLSFKPVLSYTVCHQDCYPETLTLDITIPLADKDELNPSYLGASLEAENTFPLPLTAHAEINNQFLELTLAEHIVKQCPAPEFVSIHPKKNILSDLPKTALRPDNRLQVTFSDGETPPNSEGILLCPEQTYYLPPQALTSTEFPPVSKAKSLFYYILTAFLAGLILNLMPCVLPVLSLKALYLAKHRKQASLGSALIYLCGVLSSFLVLSGIIFYLKTIGTELGWGFQLQSPVFNICLFILFFLIYLSLLDKLPISSSLINKLNKFSHNQSFLTGFFAVIIACPCTGPFMGAALGYAMLQSTLVYFSIFMALGLGYALPYVCIEAFPQLLLNYLPKPGKWMLTLKRILSVPIALTCLWLGWVIYNQLKPAFLPAPADIVWEPYHPTKVATAVNNNEPVFIDFTAKWCLICLLNDKTVLSSKEFQTLVKKQHLHLFKADWTSRDDKIKNALNTYKRNSVPLYVYYPPRTQSPIILPQILTTKIIEETLNSTTKP